MALRDRIAPHASKIQHGEIQYDKVLTHERPSFTVTLSLLLSLYLGSPADGTSVIVDGTGLLASPVEQAPTARIALPKWKGFTFVR